MKFGGFKQFTGDLKDSVTRYLGITLKENLRDLDVGLRRLSFDDNFESFKAESLEIAAGAEARIVNQFNLIPSGFLVLRQSGGGLITDGPTAWSTDFVYLTNTGGTTATITAVFLR